MLSVWERLKDIYIKRERERERETERKRDRETERETFPFMLMLIILLFITPSIYPFTREIILIGRAYNVFSNLRKCNTLDVDNILTTHSALPLVVGRGRGCLQTTVVGKCVGGSLQCCLTTTVRFIQQLAVYAHVVGMPTSGG